MWTVLICGATAYLLGAVPFGWLLARLKGIDIRAVGSGNIGATNVFRMVSKPLGVVTFMLDFTKGFAAAWVFPAVVARGLVGDTVAMEGNLMDIIFGACAIAGHNWPVYLGFRGGKGVATSAGVLTGLMPLAAGAGLLAWGVVLLFSGYVSVASMLAAVAASATAGWGMRAGLTTLPVAVVLSVLAILVIFRHRVNMVRLARGEEHRFARLWIGKRPGTPKEDGC